MKIKILYTITLILFSNYLLFIPLGHSQVAQEWVARHNGLGNAYDKATSVAVDGSGNVYVTGWGSSSGVNYDYATIKYNSSGVQQWTARYNGPDNYIDQAYSVAVDNSGNVYVTGGSRGIGTERDFCTIKYNSNGDSVWVKRYNGPGNDIDEAISVVVDASGNVYVTGYSDGGINLDYYTIKYNSSGIEQWARRYNGPATGTGSEDRPHFLAIDGSGNVYVTGESSTGFGFLDMYATIKYNSSGDSLWVARYKGQGDSGLSQPYSLAVDVIGNVYVTGRSDPQSGFGFNFDMLTIKYNSSGDSLWVARYNGPGNSSDVGQSIAVDGAGNILVTGLSVINSTADYCTIKYNPSGDTLWVVRYNGPGNSVDVAYSIAIDALNNAYITGYSRGSGTGDDYATVKYNSSGIQQWVQRYNGPGNTTDQSSALVIDGSGNVYVTGESNGMGSGLDYATIKYSQPTGVKLVSSEIPNEFNLFQNYPNPFNPVTKIKFDVMQSAFGGARGETQFAFGEVKLIVFDALGKEVATLLNQKLNAGSYQIDWNAEQFPSGIYFYIIQTRDFFETKKMILLK